MNDSPVVVLKEAKQDVPETSTPRLDEILRELLSGRPDLTDKMKEEAWTLLHYACFAGRDDLVAQILSADSAYHATALDVAFREKHESVVLRILEMCPSQVGKVTEDGETVLHRATINGFRTVVKHLLTKNPEMVNAVTHDGHTVLHYAACNRDCTVFNLILAAKPALINATTNEGWNVVHYASFNGHPALVEFLATNNATLISAVTNDGVTAMHCAAAKGHLSVVKYLLAVSPELSYAKAFGNNAVHVALDNGESAAALCLLTKIPSLINAATNHGKTPLHLAVAKDCAEVVAHILGVDATLANVVSKRKGKTLLHKAACRGHIAVAEKLLAVSPALIDAVTRIEGKTALHVAAYNSCNAMVSYLLSVKPALINECDSSGQTALHVAVGWKLQRELAESTAETLLAMKPELISMKDNDGNTVLHSAFTCQNREFLGRIWRLYPEALRVANKDNHTPFHVAVDIANSCAIEVFMWGLTWDEIESASQRTRSYVMVFGKFKAVVLRQCEGLLEVLLPDVVETVFEYLGFERAKRLTRKHANLRQGQQNLNPDFTSPKKRP